MKSTFLVHLIFIHGLQLQLVIFFRHFYILLTRFNNLFIIKFKLESFSYYNSRPTTGFRQDLVQVVWCAQSQFRVVANFSHRGSSCFGPGHSGYDCSGSTVVLCQLHKIISTHTECRSFPCQNGGTCVNEISGYKCQCAIGYSGTSCQNGTKHFYIKCSHQVWGIHFLMAMLMEAKFVSPLAEKYFCNVSTITVTVYCLHTEVR